MGNRIKQIRMANNITQDQLAERIGVKTRSLQRYESGDRDLSTELISRLCAIFNCSSDYLLGISEEEPKFWYGITKEAYEKGISREELEAAILKFLDAKNNEKGK